jgi:TctA family transporter
MFEAFISAGGQIMQPAVLAAMLLALPIGLIVGLLPGISGISALAFMIPFTFGMQPLVGLAFLLGSYAACSQGGSMTAILLGVPGEVSNAATVMDGYKLTKAGRAGYAMGAALMASAVGGLFGSALLIILLPIVQPVILSFASPENFFLSLAGIAFIAVLSSGAPIRGLIAGSLGIFMSLFGYDPIEGVPRFWMGSEYLLDGFRLIPLALGLFAIPEILALMSSGRSIAKEDRVEPISFRQGLEGFAAVFKHWGMTLRSSVIGSIIGVMPGVGGTTATFVAYAAARQTSDDPQSFGQGRIEGVIAPEASKNAEEGGALVPTLALGIPGSASMAMLLGAFLILGLQPGPEFLVKHMDLALALGYICALANFAASALMFLLSRFLVYVTRIPGRVLAPILLAFVVIGAYSAQNSETDVLYVFVFGLLGVAMERLGYSRPALLLGFVLGETIERHFQVSLKAYGWLFFMRPISIAIIVIALACLLWPSRRRIFALWGTR